MRKFITFVVALYEELSASKIRLSPIKNPGIIGIKGKGAKFILACVAMVNSWAKQQGYDDEYKPTQVWSAFIAVKAKPSKVLK